MSIKNLCKKRGQSTLEYSILIIIIAAALLSIQAYVKRGVQGRLKQATDDIGGQYSVGNTNGFKETKTHSVMIENIANGQTETQTTEDSTNETHTMTIQNVFEENWNK